MTTQDDTKMTKPPATLLVIFGASGDLTSRKLIPALCNLAEDDYLPENFIVIGSSRSKLSDDDFRARLFDGIQKFSRRPISPAVWDRFSKNVYYQPLNGEVLADFELLKARMEELCAARGERFNYVYYLAMAPQFFGPIASNLKSIGLIEDVASQGRRTSVVVEKPFGHDTHSARELNAVLRKSLAEEQIYRIDHYLGKETVQNILVFRFANGIFEPLWNRKYIDHIQISVCEDIGIGNRAAYFDQNGIVRDIVQNHVLQMLSLLCIEPPISLSDANGIRDEKAKVLRSIKRMSPDEVRCNTVRAQYSEGYIKGEKVPGYLEENGVAPASRTDTYVALKLEIDNWRWSGVPIYIRAGKRLAKRVTEIKVFFNKAPDSLFRGRQRGDLEHNVLSIQVQPKEGMSLRISSKQPGPRFRVRPVEMDFTYDSSFGVASPEAYERLLLDVMKGDPTLFTRNDEIEESWELLAPIFEVWEGPTPPPLCTYEAGTWGPASADALLQKSGHKWSEL
ncbi:MAG: glucose-6-phosphate dehydrogenase [Pseudomonadota bacterium]|jgi:glucose-6-phosphate 1-dehydrogenase